jgi:hypothetical protein
MPDNVKITINGKESFTGRLIGLIDKMECRAIMNTENAGRKLFTAESLSMTDIGSVLKDKRFVVATTSYSTDKRREVFISPVIRFLSFRYGKRTFKCEDDNEYTLEVHLK